MPIISRVTTGDVGGTSTVTASVQDVPGSGSFDPYVMDVIFIADAKYVSLASCTPIPYDQRTSAETIELRWRVEPLEGQHFRFGVQLKRRSGGRRPTCFAWTLAGGDVPTRWDAWIGYLLP